MKQIKLEKDLIGKTISKISRTHWSLFLFFDDDSFAVLKGCYDHEGEIELSETDFSFVTSLENSCELMELGYISKEEYDKLWIDHREYSEKIKEENEKKEYERLKEKFG
jgi:hypothetical protein